MSISMRHAIQAGNIRRASPEAGGSDHLNLYLGSGRCGSSFAWHGLHHAASVAQDRAGISRTLLMHADHWARGAYGIDCWLPVCRVLWDPLPDGVRSRSQDLDLYTGCLSTSFETEEYSVVLRSTYHPEKRDLLAIEIEYSALSGKRVSDIVLSPEQLIPAHYDQTFKVDVSSASVTAQTGRLVLRTSTVTTHVVMRVCSASGEQHLLPEGSGFRLKLQGQTGACLILVGIGSASRAANVEAEIGAVNSVSAYFDDAARGWSRRWGKAFIWVPDTRIQALWARSVFFLLSSYAPDVRSPAAPMGWSGNGWPFHFPQDISYIHPAMLRLGHYDIASAIVEYYRSILDDTVESTRRIYEKPGAMWAWVCPIGTAFGQTLLAGGATPNHFHYEVHNAAYPARMAAETAAHLRNHEWTLNTAWPIVRESARFLASICTKNADGTWDEQVTPSMGQDEFGGENSRNYLCALFSIQYTLQAALRMVETLGVSDPYVEIWRTIISDGLSFGRLLDPRHGIYATAENLVGRTWFATQKHPVQLNPLTFLPLSAFVDIPTQTAYERRNELCNGIAVNISDGWTLAAFWLASSHMGEGEKLARELSVAEAMNYVDPEWVQIYETSNVKGAPYYMTSHGLLVQALLDAFQSDYWGQTTRRAAVPESWAEGVAKGLCTTDQM